jgi:ankyrin repeat protein
MARFFRETAVALNKMCNYISPYPLFGYIDTYNIEEVVNLLECYKGYETIFDIKNGEEDNPLIYACKKLDSELDKESTNKINKIIKILCDFGWKDQENNKITYEISSRDIRIRENDATPLMIAVSTDNNSMFDSLIRNQARLDKNTSTQTTALKLACLTNNTYAAEMLLKKGANYSLIDDEGNTYLHNAIEEGHTDICKLLIDRDTGFIDADNNSHETPLIRAIRLGKIDICELLIEKGANIKKYKNPDDSPLYLTAVSPYFVNPEILRLLLGSGKISIDNINKDKIDRKTILEHAIGKYEEIAEEKNIPGKKVLPSSNAVVILIKYICLNTPSHRVGTPSSRIGTPSRPDNFSLEDFKSDIPKKANAQGANKRVYMNPKYPGWVYKELKQPNGHDEYVSFVDLCNTLLYQWLCIINGLAPKIKYLEVDGALYSSEDPIREFFYKTININHTSKDIRSASYCEQRCVPIGDVCRTPEDCAAFFSELHIFLEKYIDVIGKVDRDIKVDNLQLDGVSKAILTIDIDGQYLTVRGDKTLDIAYMALLVYLDLKNKTSGTKRKTTVEPINIDEMVGININDVLSYAIRNGELYRRLLYVIYDTEESDVKPNIAQSKQMLLEKYGISIDKVSSINEDMTQSKIQKTKRTLGGKAKTTQSGKLKTTPGKAKTRRYKKS